MPGIKRNNQMLNISLAVRWSAHSRWGLLRTIGKPTRAPRIDNLRRSQFERQRVPATSTR